MENFSTSTVNRVTRDLQEIQTNYETRIINARMERDRAFKEIGSLKISHCRDLIRLRFRYFVFAQRNAKKLIADTPSSSLG